MGVTILVALLVIGTLLILFAGDFGAKYLKDLLRVGYGLSVALHVIAWVMASLLAVLSFEVMYYFCPDVQKRSWRWFTPVGLIALFCSIAGSMGLRVYIHFFNSYSVINGSLGAVIILPLWSYLTGVMILG